jgi:hypothetical protein
VNIETISVSRRRFLSAFIVSTLLLAIPGCSSKQNSATNLASQELAPATTPPFATKEPQRYRAIRTVTLTGNQSPPAKTIIERDGQKRREEYETLSNERLIYLEVPTGRFLLWPSAKLFASIDSGLPPELLAGSAETPDPNLSADRLLNEVTVQTRYQKLGSEMLNGRTTTKYRVLTSNGNSGTAESTETLLWIDDLLTMPVRWETTSGEDHKKTIMELSEISLDVNDQPFEVPKEYWSVDIHTLYNLIQGNRESQKNEPIKD